MNDWFWYKSKRDGLVRCQWLEKSPDGRAHLCDRCGIRVGSTEPRLRIDNGQGKKRRNSKGKEHTYICALCGSNVPHQKRDQEKMF